MKKFFLFFFLVIFSQEVFAEGNYSFSGEFVMGSILQLPMGEELDRWYVEEASMGISDVYGEVTLNYDNDITGGNFHAELTLNGMLRGFTGIGTLDRFESVATLNWLTSYEADLFKFAIGFNSMENALTQYKDYKDSISYLYGWFFFWDKQIKFDLAYKGYDTVTGIYDKKYSYSEDLPLASDVVSDWNLGVTAYDPLIPWWGNFEGIDGARLTYRPNKQDGLIVRLAWRDLFKFKDLPAWWVDDADNYKYTIGQFMGTFTLFARYDMTPQMDIPLVFSLGYANRATKGLHFGAGYAITDAITIKGDVLAGGLVNTGKYGFLAFGAAAGYSGAPFYADLNIRFGTDISNVDRMGGNGKFEIEPIAKYAIIPCTLLAQLGAAFMTGTGDNKLMSITLAPGLYWNLKADEDTDEPDCGIRFLYTYGRTVFDGKTTGEVHNITISFHWNF